MKLTDIRIKERPEYAPAHRFSASGMVSGDDYMGYWRFTAPSAAEAEAKLRRFCGLTTDLRKGHFATAVLYLDKKLKENK